MGNVFLRTVRGLGVQVVLISYPDNETFVVKRKRIEQNSAMVANVLEGAVLCKIAPTSNFVHSCLCMVTDG